MFGFSLIMITFKKDMNKTNTTRGFTLIELLVVIAIIGILSSVVLASLNTARTKGSDAAAKGALEQLRAQAEIYYDNNASTYSSATGDTSLTDSCTVGFVASGQQGNSILTNAVSNSNTAHCYIGKNVWMIYTTLKGGSNWCVDNSGYVNTVSSVPPTNASTGKCS